MFGDILIRELRMLRVVVYHPNDANCEDLVRHIQRIGCGVTSHWPVPDEWPAEVDAVFCFFDETGDWKPRKSTVPLIAITEYENPVVVKALLEADVMGIVTKPIRPFGILSTLVLARSRYRFEARQRAKVGKLEETLRSRQLVERAAISLADSSGLKYHESYQFIRSMAMERRISMASLADAILAGTADLDPKQA